MSIRQKAKVRGGAAVAVAAVLALVLAGCGGGEEKAKEPQNSPQQSATPKAEGSAPQDPAPTDAKSEVIATTQGPAGIVLEINSAARSQDGYLTVSGQLKNTSSTAFAQTAPWRGDEKTASPASVAGATVVDNGGKKRYYVLRDTDGRCACSTGIVIIKAGENVPFFAQFPAPPATTTEVVFGLPTFAAATIKIAG